MILHIDAFWTSPYAFSAWLALKEKRVPFEVKTVGLHTKEHHAESYQQGSLTGRVPALRDGDFWLSESQAMVEYVEERFPAPAHPRVLPATPKERARARQVMAWVRSDLMPIREERPTSSFFYQQPVKPLSPRAEEAVARLLRFAEAVIPSGRTQLFEDWSVADADLALMLQRLHAHGHPLPEKVVRFVEAQWSRPFVQEWVNVKRPPFVAY